MRKNIVDMNELSIAERIELVEDLWDSIAEKPEAVVLSEEQKQILDERIKEYQEDSNPGSTWNEVTKRIKKWVE